MQRHARQAGLDHKYRVRIDHDDVAEQTVKILRARSAHHRYSVLPFRFRHRACAAARAYGQVYLPVDRHAWTRPRRWFRAGWMRFGIRQPGRGRTIPVGELTLAAKKVTRCARHRHREYSGYPLVLPAPLQHRASPRLPDMIPAGGRARPPALPNRTPAHFKHAAFSNDAALSCGSSVWCPHALRPIPHLAERRVGRLRPAHEAAIRMTRISVFVFAWPTHVHGSGSVPQLKLPRPTVQPLTVCERAAS
jgi:hypothetical protein